MRPFGLGGFGLSRAAAGGGGAPDYFADLNTALASSDKSAVWPVDTDYVFQDTSLTPVTADGQAVGFQFDASKLGGAIPLDYSAAASEIAEASSFTNSGFDSFSYSGGTLTLDKTDPSGADKAYSNAVFPVTLNKWYCIELDISALSGGSTVFTVGFSSTTNARSTFANITATGTQRFMVRPNVATGTFSVTVQAGAIGNITITDIRVKEIPGLHRHQTTAENRPLYKVSGASEWLLFDKSNDRLAFEMSGAAGSANMDYVAGLYRAAGQMVAAAEDANDASKYFGMVQDSDASASFLGAGSPSQHIDGSAVPGGTSSTRDQLHDAWAATTAIRYEARGLDLSTWVRMTRGAYTSYLQMEREFGSVLVNRASLEVGASDLARAWIDEEIA